jgi:hypothetical protein
VRVWCFDDGDCSCLLQATASPTPHAPTARLTPGPCETTHWCSCRSSLRVFEHIRLFICLLVYIKKERKNDGVVI